MVNAAHVEGVSQLRLERRPNVCHGAAFLAFAMLLHDRPRGDFLRAFAITAGPLGGFLDVFVLALFLAARASQMFFTWHIDFSYRAKIRTICEPFQGGPNPPFVSIT